MSRHHVPQQLHRRPMPIKAAGPSRQGPGLVRKAFGVLIFGLAFVALGAVALPLMERGRGTPTGSVASNDVGTVDPFAGKSALQQAMEAADAAQEQAEAAYTGVSVPADVNHYVVAVPDAPKTTTLTRPVTAVTAPQLPPNSGAGAVARLVDQEIDRKLAEAKLAASPLADDAEFVRRVHLDLTGKIPTYEQTVAFLADRDAAKRSKIIDAILASDSWGQHWASLWTELLVKRDFDNNRNLKTDAFAKWLGERFNKGEPWNQTVHALLTAEGTEKDNPAIFFLLANQDNGQPAANKLAGATGNLFLGIQLQCAECHVHPFTSKWKPADFWGMAAFFGRAREIEREMDSKGKEKPGTGRYTDAPLTMKGEGKKGGTGLPVMAGGVISIPDPTNARKTVGTAPAKFFESSQPALDDQQPYRPVVAEWVTSSRNPYFAPAMVNRTWAQLFARGFVNPVDDMKDDNAPSHPVALKLLADEFVKSNYDVKFLLRCLLNTQAYQRTSRPLPGNKDDETLYSHMPVKVLSADALLDSLAVATGAAAARGGENKGKAKGGGGSGLRGFFDVTEYGDDPRDYAYGIPHVLKLMNTNLSNAAYQAAERVAKGKSKDKAIEDIYLTVLSRPPSADETKRMQEFVAKQGDGRGLGGVFWALLNSAEFVCNR